MKNNILIIFVYFSLLIPNSINNYNSIYYLAKDSKSNSLGGIHTLSKNISGVFYQPFSKNNIKGDIFLSYINQFDNAINIIQFGYCVSHDNDKNISIGFVSRNINDIYDTSDAWNPLNFSDEPSFNTIDYSNISNLKYQNIGFIVAYNKFLKKSIINIKIKPNYESIEPVNATGLDVDLMLNKSMKNINLIIGINDLLSYKKWNTGAVENNKLSFFVSTSVYINHIGFFIESSSLYNEKIGFEYNSKDLIYIRVGTNIDEDIFCGIALNFNAIELSYAYIPMNKLIGDVSQLSLSFKLSGLKDLKEKIKP